MHILRITSYNQRLSPDIRITRNPDLPAHFGTRIPDTPNPGTQMSDEHYFNAFFGTIMQHIPGVFIGKSTDLHHYIF